MEVVTPHIRANKEDFAKTVIMLGDPLRAEHIATNYLKDFKKISGIRGIYAYTGSYKEKLVTVMACNMGMPSMGIYSYELFNIFGIERIIRIGTAGSINDNVKLKDVIIAMGACTDSNYIKQYNLNGSYAPIASYDLLRQAVDTAQKMDLSVTVGNILTTDVFYNSNIDSYKKWAEMGVLAVDMETAALYMTAARFGKQALMIGTISDEIFTGKACSPEERQTGFNNMIELSLNTISELRC
ncbi:MAG: purine-nucleoside phosphorylase [Oscillospiraceae bacterium]|nr:purine-nucleoside phosphorylase [Oscillospiraceae bacterium]